MRLRYESQRKTSEGWSPTPFWPEDGLRRRNRHKRRRAHCHSLRRRTRLRSKEKDCRGPRSLSAHRCASELRLDRHPWRLRRSSRDRSRSPSASLLGFPLAARRSFYQQESSSFRYSWSQPRTKRWLGRQVCLWYDLVSQARLLRDTHAKHGYFVGGRVRAGVDLQSIRCRTGGRVHAGYGTGGENVAGAQWHGIAHEIHG